ncbi:peptidoglycan-binding protein [Streptomyces sp. FXJ1.172]|uniref:peptidoglycan-binding domain-containing protein n=1 Tax=Streptomyces sp. FXJ1.172 TaxID=710705 RepID=UPI0007CF9CBA|nr:peptidoglycan-binding domain-containing protein [Streptomyces sp. FXJ1.172]WEO93759.1 peptidoglycan-binding protein [Streptomyces sp. FXJ1.172]
MPTPPDPERPQPGPVLEPVRVLRPRRFDALAELMREIRPDPVTYEPVAPAAGSRPAPARTAPTAERPAAARTVPTAEDDTQELPPVPTARPAPGVRAPALRLRRAAVAGAVAAAALAGFGCALLLPARQEASAAARPSRPATTAPPAATPTAAAPAPATGAADPDGPGTLRQGDTGPEVTELQERLLRIPDVYRDGSTDGTYDATLTAAVARFQLWYGIRGDETGVYGNDTRSALESRTTPGDAS